MFNHQAIQKKETDFAHNHTHTWNFLSGHAKTQHIGIHRKTSPQYQVNPVTKLVVTHKHFKARFKPFKAN